VKSDNISFVPRNTQCESKTLGQTSGESFPQYNKEKRSHNYMSAKTQVLRRNSQYTLTSILQICISGET